jgi:diamine N-acetyltransferase
MPIGRRSSGHCDSIRVDEEPERVSDRGETGPAIDITLRPTTEFDLDWVLRTEHTPENEPLITRWSRAAHSAALRHAGTRHLIIRDAAGDRLGYVILRGIGDPDPNIELLRLVVAEQGRGVGRTALRLIVRMAFDELHAHRLWLDVVTTNTRARELYRSEGFVEEGILREAARRASGYVSLVMMSMLEDEYRDE